MNVSAKNSAVLNRLLALCESKGGSDIHLVAGACARMRIEGRLEVPSGEAPLTPETVREIALSLAATSLRPDADVAKTLLQEGAIDGAFCSPSGARYRFNSYLEQNNAAVALRRLDDNFRSLEELGLPQKLGSFAELPDGLVIVSGPTGSGKSTTLATLIDNINSHRDGHIITIEDPIEYVHASKRSLVRQRQVGRDAASFNSALVQALRQDPDVILVGEIREIETIRTAIVAAETGHLVFTTLHAGDCVGAIERFVSVFPADEQSGIRRQLSLVLRGVFAQHLIPRADKPGRIACGELLVVSPAVSNLIANGRSAQIYSAMEIGAKDGMSTLEQDLVRLCLSGVIDESHAMALTRFPDMLKDRLRTARLSGKTW